MKNIVLIATAAKYGGALSILLQFLNNVPSDFQLTAFVSVDTSILPQESNIHYINPKVNSWIKRIIWEYWTFRRYCKKNNIQPNIIVSLQNTGVFYNKKVKQVIYYHQPVPLYPYQWSLLKKEQRVLWFYKNMYLFFVKLTITKNTVFIVQFDWIKKTLGNLLKKYQPNIKVIKASANDIDITNMDPHHLPAKYNILYPASFLIYKNHIEIINAIVYLKETGRLGNYTVYCIGSADVPQNLIKEINKHELEQHFVFLNYLPYKDLLRYVKSCDLIVFPSMIETLGLPLLEAASFGKTILVADLEYAREVIGGYQGAHFVPLHNPKAWGESIISLANKNINYESFSPQDTLNSWSVFFNLINEELSC